MRLEDTTTDSTFSWDGLAAWDQAGAEISMANTAVLLDSARRRFAQPDLNSIYMKFPHAFRMAQIFR
jgi:hypothetical protein